MDTTTKTQSVLEWLSELPEPHRSRAIKNAKGDPVDHRKKQVEKMYLAIVYGFSWSASPEGFEYWKNLFDSHLK